MDGEELDGKEAAHRRLRNTAEQIARARSLYRQCEEGSAVCDLDIRAVKDRIVFQKRCHENGRCCADLPATAGRYSAICRFNLWVKHLQSLSEVICNSWKSSVYVCSKLMSAEDFRKMLLTPKNHLHRTKFSCLGFFYVSG